MHHTGLGTRLQIRDTPYWSGHEAAVRDAPCRSGHEATGKGYTYGSAYEGNGCTIWVWYKGVPWMLCEVI